MKFEVYSTDQNRYEILEKYPCLIKYGFRKEKATRFNPLLQTSEDIEIGYIEVDNLEILVKFMEEVDEDIIITKNEFGEPVIEIYDCLGE